MNWERILEEGKRWERWDHPVVHRFVDTKNLQLGWSTTDEGALIWWAEYADGTRREEPAGIILPDEVVYLQPPPWMQALIRELQDAEEARLRAEEDDR